MFIPIGDDNRDRRTTPYVNYLIILANILVFIFLQDWGNNIHFTYAYSTVPAEILTGHDIVTGSQIAIDPYSGQRVEIPGLGRTDIPVYLTLITSTFMHGGIAHILGNMLYLWIFGDNLEDAMGHTNYFFFYMLCGVLAGLTHVFSTYFFGQGVYLPSLGASGAIAGVLGGYILLFPRRRVHVWLFFFFTISVPAFLAVGIWFVFQVINSLGMLGGEEAGSVAYGAHIGGFIAGLVLVKLFARRRPALVNERKSFW
ncbi:MAG TPA: rhomboid family intramembrane serine protease [Flavisolibacter sp.]|nr:rhomboid family intramembrane serine protease [Flavisolibacter sp.]